MPEDRLDEYNDNPQGANDSGSARANENLEAQREIPAAHIEVEASKPKTAKEREEEKLRRIAEAEEEQRRQKEEEKHQQVVVNYFIRKEIVHAPQQTKKGQKNNQICKNAEHACRGRVQITAVQTICYTGKQQAAYV